MRIMSLTLEDTPYAEHVNDSKIRYVVHDRTASQFWKVESDFLDYVFTI